MKYVELTQLDYCWHALTMCSTKHGTVSARGRGETPQQALERAVRGLQQVTVGLPMVRWEIRRGRYQEAQ